LPEQIINREDLKHQKEICTKKNKKRRKGSLVDDKRRKDLCSRLSFKPAARVQKYL